ncbi:hypothetical protein PCA20602_01940 [Pandoraea capi]|uniref:Uncharacterized protein n=1 Tax=Pandoraea capi TaxID=2508286 RepID=A0ABY6VWF3_9BURK|nr:hypothetical protein PCA20602_01940 [Pandoraea capi]
MSGRRAQYDRGEDVGCACTLEGGRGGIAGRPGGHDVVDQDDTAGVNTRVSDEYVTQIAPPFVAGKPSLSGSRTVSVQHLRTRRQTRPA